MLARDIDSNPSIRPEYRVFGTSKPNPNIKILKSEYRIRIFFFFAEYRIIQGPLLTNPNIPNIGLLFCFTIFFCFFFKMANVEESDVAAECEYRKEKGVAKWHEKFLVEYRGGRKTEGRKCIKCNVLIKSIGVSPIRTVLGKWIDNNPVITALINKSGSFFETIRKFAVEPESATQVASNDHQYVAVEEGLSFAEFNNNCQLDEFDIFAFLENFRPSSVDPERLFSLCRLSRNYLQNRLSPENHSRNVFLNKNKRFLKLNCSLANLF